MDEGISGFRQTCHRFFHLFIVMLFIYADYKIFR